MDFEVGVHISERLLGDLRHEYPAFRMSFVPDAAHLEPSSTVLDKDVQEGCAYFDAQRARPCDLTNLTALFLPAVERPSVDVPFN